VSKNYLGGLPLWNPDIAKARAEERGVALEQAHWDIILVARQFYEDFGFSPSSRPLAKCICEKLGAEKARSIYLLTLFPDSPARKIAEISGLPAPKNCL